MTAQAPVPPSGLVDAIEHAHREASLALARDRSLLDAIGWLSAHLAAVERAVHPVAWRVLPDGPARVGAQRASAHALQHTLFLLDRRLTGDTRTSRMAVDRLVARVDEELDEHSTDEHHLLAALIAALPEAQSRSLADAYAAASAHAPTRPHPFNPDHRGLRALAFHVDAVVDRVRDLLDNRRAPTRGPRRPPRAPGRWGLYLLGTAASGREQPHRLGGADDCVDVGRTGSGVERGHLDQ